MAAESERAPIGVGIPAVGKGVEIPPESPDIGARALSVASRLMCGATAFFFMAFAFAYFYLRSINADDMWHPAHVHPSKGLGTAFILCVLLSAALSIVASRQMKRESPTWVTAAFGGIGLGLVAVALQCIEYTRQHFGPTNGGFASVFCAWTAFYLIAVLFTMFWLETQVATEFRARHTPAGSEGDIKDPDEMIAPALDAAVFYWCFLAAIGVVTYVVLYLL